MTAKNETASVEFRALDPDEREECIALWRAVWRDDMDAYFRRYLFGDIEWLPYYTQVAVTDGKIVSAVHICKRIVACGEYRLTMGGIGNVATLAEYRGRGYNAECLRRAIQVMEADAMDFSLLFTGIQSYYERRGYSVWNRAARLGRIVADVSARLFQTSNIRVRPARAEDLPRIEALHAEFNRDRPIAVLRTSGYWRDWLRMEPSALSRTLLVATDLNDHALGYLRCNVKNGEMVVDEIAYADAAGSPAGPQLGALLGSLFAAVAERARAEGCVRVRLETPRDAAIEAACALILEEQSEVANRSGMVRLLHRVSLLKSLTFEWTERWINAGRPPGILRVRTPYGAVEIDAAGQFLKIQPTDDDLNAVTQSELFGLLFDGASDDACDAHADNGKLLRALFPVRGAVYWRADGF